MVSCTHRPLYPRGKRPRYPLNRRQSTLDKIQISCTFCESNHDSSVDFPVLVPNKKAKKINIHIHRRNENKGGTDRKKNWESINREKTKNKYIHIAGFGDVAYCTVLMNSEILSYCMMRQPVGVNIQSVNAMILLSPPPPPLDICCSGFHPPINPSIQLYRESIPPH